MGNECSTIPIGTIAKVGMGKHVYILYQVSSPDPEHRLAIICYPTTYKNGYASMHNPYIEQALSLDGVVSFVTRGECKLLSKYNDQVPVYWKRLHDEGKYTWYDLRD